MNMLLPIEIPATAPPVRAAGDSIVVNWTKTGSLRCAPYSVTKDRL